MNLKEAREREHLNSRGLIQMKYRRPWQRHMGIQEIESETMIL